MLIAISKYLKPIDEVDKYRKAHWAFLEPLFESGKLFLSGRRNSSVGGVIMAHAITREEFEIILANDPFTLSGSAHYQVFEFTPSFYAPGLKEFLV